MILLNLLLLTQSLLWVSYAGNIIVNFPVSALAPGAIARLFQSL